MLYSSSMSFVSDVMLGAAHLSYCYQKPSCEVHSEVHIRASSSTIFRLRAQKLSAAPSSGPECRICSLRLLLLAGPWSQLLPAVHTTSEPSQPDRRCSAAQTTIRSFEVPQYRAAHRWLTQSQACRWRTLPRLQVRRSHNSGWHRS